MRDPSASDRALALTSLEQAHESRCADESARAPVRWSKLKGDARDGLAAEKVVYNGRTRVNHAEVGKMSGKCLDSRVAESTTSRSMLSPRFVEENCCTTCVSAFTLPMTST